MKPIIHALTKCEHALIASHIQPDGDALGSLIAMGLTVQSLGKQVTLYNESPIPAVYGFLPCLDRIKDEIGKTELEPFDLGIVLDCGDLDRIGKMAKEMGNIPQLINIDHHPTNFGFGDYNLIDETACATAEIIYRLIRSMNIQISRDIALCLYTGIITDTGSFRFANTNQAAFSICEEMVSLGVEPYEVASHVYGRYSLGRLKLLNLALNSIEISHNGKLSVMMLTKNMFDETDTHPEDVEGMINYAKRIRNVKVAVLIREYINGHRENNGNQHFHVSLRSDGTVNVAAIAARFGGGGHYNAAGFNVESENIEDLKKGIFSLAYQI
jgi:phosphoesterase RecJ-like protein